MRSIELTTFHNKRYVIIFMIERHELQHMTYFVLRVHLDGRRWRTVALERTSQIRVAAAVLHHQLVHMQRLGVAWPAADHEELCLIIINFQTIPITKFF